MKQFNNQSIMNITVTKMVSDKLKTKAQGTGGVYDGTYGEKPATETVAEVKPDDIESGDDKGDKVETSVAPEVKAEAPATAPEAVTAPDGNMCVCEHCKGTGKVAKALEAVPGTEALEVQGEPTEPTEAPKAQNKGPVYDGTYGEEETPALKAKRILNSTVSFNDLLGRKAIKPTPWQSQMTSMLKDFESKVGSQAQAITAPKIVGISVTKVASSIPLPSFTK